MGFQDFMTNNLESPGLVPSEYDSEDGGFQSDPPRIKETDRQAVLLPNTAHATAASSTAKRRLGGEPGEEHAGFSSVRTQFNSQNPPKNS